MKKLDDIKILQESDECCLRVYKLTKSFPDHERFGISSQVQRASVSVSANIAEGFYRGTNKDFANFLIIARGSVGETITLLKLCYRLSYISLEEYTNIRSKYEMLLPSINSLIKYIKTHVRPEKVKK